MPSSLCSGVFVLLWKGHIGLSAHINVLEAEQHEEIKDINICLISVIYHTEAILVKRGWWVGTLRGSDLLSWSQRAAWFIAFVCYERFLRMVVGGGGQRHRQTLFGILLQSCRAACTSQSSDMFPARHCLKGMWSQGATGLGWLTAEGVNWAIVWVVWWRRETERGKEGGWEYRMPKICYRQKWSDWMHLGMIMKY